MTSKNFEFLRAHNRELAELAAFAERYVFSDPASAMVKLRLFGENMVKDFFTYHRLPRLPQANYLELLKSIEEQGLVPPVVLTKLHTLRTQGNRAAHGKNTGMRSDNALWVLQEAFDLGKWLALSLHGDAQVQSLRFENPEPDKAKSEMKQAKKEALRKLADQEMQMQDLLRELEEARQKAETAEKTLAEQQNIFARTNQAASSLDFDEKTTRDRLIDLLLVQAGWDVAPGEKTTSEVGKEVVVSGHPTDTGKGRADYVLWDDNGKPLAVIEAKKTSEEASKGRTQAKLYADALEAEHGQRPVIFYTNGYDIFLWDDAKGEVPRRVFGFYSKDSLQHCLWKTEERGDVLALAPRTSIIDRRYQIEAVKRICEQFANQRRKALIVQATGTGKTRVGIALCELLMRAHWAKRILFLCDRRELRKQANNAFAAPWAEGINHEPRVYVTSATADDRQPSIYLATYPAMSKCYQSFDVGFFDLIIADESHRSIYNRYRDLFLYFDALQVGLTATPRNVITHDTYRMFDCEGDNPTAHFSYNEAIEHVPPYLSHFEVVSHTTKFLRKGIRYKDMTPEQRKQLESQMQDADKVDYSKEQVDKQVFNKDTDRRILRNLIENGMRGPSGQQVGKTIIFARDHNHAVQMRDLFEEMYPQFMTPRKEFCAVIDNYETRAEQLIDDFKGDGKNDNLTIAISVDMLDTGIDVPEVLNLVFAKPVKSYVKFWQMIGRGTRLCENLFGPGEHKESFQIFDHWGNFEWFGEDPPEVEPTVKKSLLQQLFETRIELAETALGQQDVHAFYLATELLYKDVRSLPDETVHVREKWREVKAVQREGVIRTFDAATVATLRNTLAPLMQYRSLDGVEEAYRFDLLCAKLQLSLLKQDAAFESHKEQLCEQVGQLPVNLEQVQAKNKWIQRVKSNRFWNSGHVQEEPAPYLKAAEPHAPYGSLPEGPVDVHRLEEIRRELRGIMHCRNKPRVDSVPPLYIDVTDSEEIRRNEVVKLDGLDLAAYRHRVEHVLKELMVKSEVLRRIHAGESVDSEELKPLIEAVLLQEPDLNVEDLLVHYPNRANRLDLAIRQIIGLDAEAVDRVFTRFVQKYPGLSSHQMRFLALVQKQFVHYGRLEIDKLYEEPFTQLHMEGVDGVFSDDQQIDDLLELITEINELAPGEVS